MMQSATNDVPRGTFGAWLRARRKAVGLSQDEVGSSMGVSGQSVSNWERDAVLPSDARLSTLARVLGVTHDELFKAANRPPPALADLLHEPMMARLVRLAARLSADDRATLVARLEDVT